MSSPNQYPHARRRLALISVWLLVTPAAALAQAQASDTLRLSLLDALEAGQRENPVVLQSAFSRSAAGAGVWDAYGNLMPQVGFQGFAQRSEAGTFNLGGRPFISPLTYTTTYQWDFTHTLLDSGRDIFRIRSARAESESAIAAYNSQWWQTRADIKQQYLGTRRQQALLAQAAREIERLEHHLLLAESRYDVGEVTKSDVLQAQLGLNQGQVASLEARQAAEEALLALQRLVGGLPSGPIELTTDFEVFRPPFDVENLVDRALDLHPSVRETEAQERADRANLWIARSAYFPGLQFQYSRSKSAADTSDFQFSDLDSRNFWVFSLNWQLFDGFSRHNETSRANAALQSTRAERRRRELSIEESVRTAHSRLMTSYAAHQANMKSVELATEDLRLGEARYETGAGSFVDLLDSQVRAAEAETDLIASAYDFYVALVELERGSGLDLFPERVRQ
jgi:outer membrane protein TolC